MKKEKLRKRFTLHVTSFLLLLALGGAINPSSHASAYTDGWNILATGIDYKLFQLTNPRPINLYVSRLNRSEPLAIIDTALAQGSLVNGRETISGMATRYDQAINFWEQTWGNRNRVVVTINGYFFNLSTGTPLSGQIHSSWYAQRFSDYVGDAGFAWNLDRSAFIGKCVFHTARNQFLTVLRSGETKKISGVNAPRGADALILYTPQYAATTVTDSSGVEVLVEMSRPSMVLPEPAVAKGTVVQIRDYQGNSTIPFDHVVLSATGVVRADLLTKLQVGGEIGISQEINDCPNNPPKFWTKTYASMGGDYHFLTNGYLTIDNSNPDAAVPNSRTAVALNSSYIFFIVVDGWNHGISEGINVTELGYFARDSLGATDAVTLDSGGSSTMVIYGQIVNNTYCNIMRNCGMQPTQDQEKQSNYNEVPYSFATGAPGLSTLTEPETAMPDLEPSVGNALMMLVVEPKIQSTVLSPGMAVVTNRYTELRLGPGTNYAALASLSMGTEGTILGMRYSDLGGVLAKGAYWQYAEFSNQAGWLDQNALARIPITWPPGLFMPLIHR